MNLLKTIFKNRDRRVSVLVFIFAIVWLVMAKDIRGIFGLDGSADPGPRLFPYIIGILLVVTSIGKFLTCNQEDESGFYENYKGWLKAGAVFVLLFIYCWLFPILGFAITTFAGGIASVLLLKGDKKVSWYGPVLFSGILTGVMYVLFVKVLNVMMPTGSLWKLLF